MLFYYFESLQKFSPLEGDFQLVERKKKFFAEIKRFEREHVDRLGISKANNESLFEKLKQYYPITEAGNEERIPFLYFVNRMSFWMATGSGKTIVLIKLIEMLDRLKTKNLVPNNDILILTQREDLVQQITELIQDYNRLSTRKIRVWDLTRFEEVKRGAIIAFKDDINVFIYQSHLIAEETKEKEIGFEDIENGGKWFLLLDEAHKGDKEDSKRQLYYSLMSRNGFLFNYSATFTDPWDILTTVYNFNLDSFIRQGYGKNVYLSQQELSAFKDKSDFTSKEKKSVILRALILFTLMAQAKAEMDSDIKMPMYHKPLLVSLVNSVNTQDADLEIFFKALEEIGSEDIDSKLFNHVKEELSNELLENPEFEFGNESLRISKEKITSVRVKDLRRAVFHTERKGSIEVKKIPENEKELIFKLKTADLPFALMRVGDCGKWVKEKLTSYHIEETYDNESYFEHLDEENDHINILMGSRAFYEGWDSNRPNVMLFINIGRGDAKKYVVQSIGRGVRIRPIQNKRKRLSPLAKEGDSTAKKIRSILDPADVSLIETLFVLGTNRKNVEQILKGITYERKVGGQIVELTENPARAGKSLLIPTYKEWPRSISVGELPKFEGDRTLLKNLFDWIGDDKVVYALCAGSSMLEPSTVNKAREFLDKGAFAASAAGGAFYQLTRLMTHVNVRLRDLDTFRELSDEIVHFKRIRVDLPEGEFQRLAEIISKVRDYEGPSREAELKEQLKHHKIDIDVFSEELKKLSGSRREESFSSQNAVLRIKNILNHYYLPVIVSDEDKIDYINHIISVESERKFLAQLETYLGTPKNGLGDFDWWMFSKLDEHLDEVYIPYYNRVHNKLEHFKPDFIFWLKRGKDYHILLVDPKGTKHTDYEMKVDGYKLVFESEGTEKVFPAYGNRVRVHLFLFTEDRNVLAEGYRRHWFDSFEKITSQLGRESSKQKGGRPVE